MKILRFITFALMLTGCREIVPLRTALSVEEVKTLAQQLANDEAAKQYHCRPFKDGASARFEQGHWVWSDRKGCGQGDIEVVVLLAADGSTNMVELMFLDNRARLF